MHGIHVSKCRRVHHNVVPGGCGAVRIGNGIAYTWIRGCHASVTAHLRRPHRLDVLLGLAEGAPGAKPANAAAKDWSYWKEAILTDLERIHKDIRKCVSRIDIMRMGHAMVRPAVGSIFSPERSRLKRAVDRLYFANSDLSGISIFEEAQYHGVTAAERALHALGS